MKGVHEGDPFGYGAEWDKMLEESSKVEVTSPDGIRFDIHSANDGLLVKDGISLQELLDFVQECPHLKFTVR